MKGDSKSIRTMQGFPRHRLYMSLFAAFAVLAADFPVHAQQSSTESAATQQYSIAAESLGDALSQLAAQGQLHIVYAPELVRGRTSPAINGRLTWHQALKQLLAGTGLEWSVVGHNLVTIRKAPEAPQPSRGQRGASIQGQSPTPAPTTTTLKAVTVLGSLIPRSQIETASPLIVITAEDIKNRGFSSVADALQNLTVNTGATNNTAIESGAIWAAKTVSLFGLDPSYTKFLIDGRPMPSFSMVAETKTVDQLYTNLSGIPIDLVERIEILPGGQSSLYGSDAIAGVINIVLKKHANVATLDARTGWYSDGGGRERMLSFTNSFSVGKLNLMVGAQVGDQQPMWAFQRSITAQNFAGGINPQQPNQDVSVQGQSTGLTYFPAQPSDCNAFAGLWKGSERYYTNNYGAFCGSTTSGGYQTLMNKSKSANLSVHASYAVNDNVQLYADLLDNYQQQASEGFGGFFALFDDPNLQDVVALNRNFAPEEMASNLDGLLTAKNYENTYQATVGGKGDLGRGWNLDVAFTRSLESNDDRQNDLLASNLPGSYGYALLGPKLGTDVYGYPIYTPDYGRLTQVLTPAQYAAYTGAASIHSTQRNDQLRAQLTQTSLFPLPGGDAGLAMVAEEGFESWKYLPEPLLTSGELEGISFNPSDGQAEKQFPERTKREKERMKL